MTLTGRTRAAAVGLAAAVTLVAGAGPSTAAADYYQPPTPFSNSFEFEDCDGAVEGQGSNRGIESLRNVPGSDGQAFLLTSAFTFQVQLTNKNTGRSVTERGQRLIREVSGERVADADVDAVVGEDVEFIGPVYKFVVRESGNFSTIRDATGKVLLSERGFVEYEQIFDTLGDSQPGGEVLAETVLREQGQFAPEGFDFCQFVLDATS